MLMKWPSLHALRKAVAIPDGVTLEQLDKLEIVPLIKKLKIWYPTITVGSESRHLQKSFYLNSVFLKNGNSKKDIFPFVFKDEKKSIIALYTLEVNRLSKSMSGPLGVIEPKYRSHGISNVFAPLMIHTAKLMSVDLVHGFVTLEHRFIQQSFEKEGFVPVGIIPAFDLDRMQNGQVKRVYEVAYAKVLCPENLVELPKPECMTAEVKKLWDFLFGGSNSLVARKRN